MSSDYAISHWPDTKQILADLDTLVGQPMRSIRRNKMELYLDYFEARCPRSKELNSIAREFIPGGAQHNTAFNYPFPLAFSRAEGPYLWDVDGNRYIDFTAAGGPVVLGHAVPAVNEKVFEVLNTCSPSIGLFHEYELKLARLINKHMPSIEMFRMMGSGTEAVMGAIRVARVFTEKLKVIKVGGDYHGWSDQMVYSLHIPGTKDLEAIGIPKDCLNHTQEIFPNDIDALYELMKANEKEGGTAAVIVEPLGPESATRPVIKNFNQKVRDLCDEFEALLIFDEVVTGFRVGLGGAQGYLGVRPDITILGKCIAGGYPAAGGIGGRRDVLSRLAAGIESLKPKAYVGGTLAANVLSCVAGYHAIKEIERTNALVKAGRAGDKLTQGLRGIMERRNLPFIAYNFASICHLQTSAVMLLDITNPNAIMEAGPRKHMLEEMGAAFTAEGIITIAGSRIYTNASDTGQVIDDALERFDRVFSNIE